MPSGPISKSSRRKTLISSRQTAFCCNLLAAVATPFCSLVLRCGSTLFRWEVMQEQKRGRDEISGAFLVFLEFLVNRFDLLQSRFDICHIIPESSASCGLNCAGALSDISRGGGTCVVSRPGGPSKTGSKTTENLRLGIPSGLIFYESVEILIPDLRLEMQLLAMGRHVPFLEPCRNKSAQARVPVPLNPKSRPIVTFAS
jgi:hypothetical protein